MSIQGKVSASLTGDLVLDGEVVSHWEFDYSVNFDPIALLEAGKQLAKKVMELNQADDDDGISGFADLVGSIFMRQIMQQRRANAHAAATAEDVFGQSSETEDRQEPSEEEIDVALDEFIQSRNSQSESGTLDEGKGFVLVEVNPLDFRDDDGIVELDISNDLETGKKI